MTPVRDILGIVFITRLVHRKQKLVHTMKAMDPRMLNVIFKAINYFNIYVFAFFKLTCSHLL